jgi:hypothetical protein
MERVTENALTNQTLLPKQSGQTTARKFDRWRTACVNGRLPKGYGNLTKPRWLKAPQSPAENNVMSGWAGGAGAPDRATSDRQWPGETPIRPSLTAFSAGTVVGPADDHSGLLEMASEASPGTNREASRCSSHHHPSLQFALFADAGQGCERLRSNP